VIFFLKYDLLKDMKSHVCLRLQSDAEDIEIL